MRTRYMTTQFICSFSFLLGTTPLWAKGLNEVTPEVEESSDATPDEAPAVSEDANKAEEKAEEATKDAETVKNLPADVKPSEMSAKLADKIFLGLDLGFARAKASEGTWTSGSSGGLMAGYQLKESFLGKNPLYLTGHYAPINVTVTKNTQSYRGVLEGYLIGGYVPYTLKNNLRAVGVAEFGFVKGHFHSNLTYDNPSPPKDSGVLLAVGGGVEWLFLNKIAVGPRLNLGFGSFQTLQLALASEFFF